MNTEIEVKIGKIIKKFRTKNNISQTELGDVLGVVHTTISRYETGKIDIPLSKLSEISEYLGFEPKEYISAFYSDDNIIFALRNVFSTNKAIKLNSKTKKEEQTIIDKLPASSIEYIIAMSDLMEETSDSALKNKLHNDVFTTLEILNSKNENILKRLNAYAKYFEK